MTGWAPGGDFPHSAMPNSADRRDSLSVALLLSRVKMHACWDQGLARCIQSQSAMSRLVCYGRLVSFSLISHKRHVLVRIASLHGLSLQMGLMQLVIGLAWLDQDRL